MKIIFATALTGILLFTFSACKKDKKTEDATPTAPAHKVGDTYGGGIVFYVDASGEHGLIAAAADQGTAVWGCSGTEVTGAAFVAIGTGQSNTNAILAGCATSGIAARLCDELVLNGYSDWYLPSGLELEKLFDQGALGNLDNDAYYWTSTSYGATSARVYKFEAGGHTIQDATSTRTVVRKVRAIRSF